MAPVFLHAKSSIGVKDRSGEDIRHKYPKV